MGKEPNPEQWVILHGISARAAPWSCLGPGVRAVLEVAARAAGPWKGHVGNGGKLLGATFPANPGWNMPVAASLFPSGSSALMGGSEAWGPGAVPGAWCPVHRREAAGGQVLPGCSSQGRRICSKPWQRLVSQLMWALQRPSPSPCAPKTTLLRAPINLLGILGALCKNFWKLAWHLQITQVSLQGSLQPSSGTEDVPGMRMGNVDGDPWRGSRSRIASPLNVLRPGEGRGVSASAGGSTGCPSLQLCLTLPPRLAAVNKAARTPGRDLCGPGSRV